METYMRCGGEPNLLLFVCFCPLTAVKSLHPPAIRYFLPLLQLYKKHI